MNAKHAKNVRLIYGIFLGVFTAVIGVLFIVGVSQIYFADPDGEPFSYEIVGKKLMEMLIPVIAWIVAVIVGYVLSVLFPVAESCHVGGHERTALKRLTGRMPKGEGEEFLAEKSHLKRLTIVRISVWSVAAAFGVAAAIISIVYLANTAHFSGTDVNKEMLQMLRHIMPWIGASFVLFIGASVYEYFSTKRELASAKKLLVLGRGYPIAGTSQLQGKWNAVLAAVRSDKLVFAIRIAIAAVAFAFIFAGIVNGGMTDVLGKAVKICKECIGMG